MKPQPFAPQVISYYRLTPLQRARRVAASLFHRFTTWRT